MHCQIDYQRFCIAKAASRKRCFFLCQKEAVMLTMIVLLVLLYAMNGSFAVPTVCFVLSWIGIGFGAFDLILKLFLKAYEKHLD